MAEAILVRVVELVGSPLCVASEDGQRVYDQISVALRESKGVRLSFANAELVTSAFLNSAIGQLYDEFSEDVIRNLLSVEDMQDDDL